MSDWPGPPSQDEKYLELLYGARLTDANAEREHERAVELARDEAKYALQKAVWDTEHSLHIEYHKTISDVARGVLERSRQGGEFLEKAAAAIATVYTGVLALSYSATGTRLPIQGIIAPLFLGITIAFAAAYLAFLRRAPEVPARQARGSLRETQEERTFFLLRWTQAGAFNKAFTIRAAVVSLFMGIAFLPAPFIELSTSAVEEDVEGDVDTKEEAIEWPQPDDTISGAQERRILYEEQVDYFRDQLEAEKAPAPGQPLAPWGIAAAAGMAGVFVGPWLYGAWERGHK